MKMGGFFCFFLPQIRRFSQIIIKLSQVLKIILIHLIYGNKNDFYFTLYSKNNSK